VPRLCSNQLTYGYGLIKGVGTVIHSCLYAFNSYQSLLLKYLRFHEGIKDFPSCRPKANGAVRFMPLSAYLSYLRNFKSNPSNFLKLSNTRGSSLAVYFEPFFGYDLLPLLSNYWPPRSVFRLRVVICVISIFLPHFFSKRNSYLLTITLEPFK